ncbi:ROK family protein [Thermasporomyces composti]|uniref:Putative NBD/HSP70 family sugar kinase n=1 Tax=Thermasporomyces composti TaxID=696763 RepID=A0A3D9VAU3_THECX|nr:ROK family protein [Thermasporomyces composti]REF37833.1 putative NBD/HSP70 family sugar kinase [Thermasporomyces composti]
MTGATWHLSGRADHGDVRRANLALVVRVLRSGPRTRAGLAHDTTLTKATVSSLVGELVDRGLVRESGPATAGAVGRPGQQVALVGERVVGVGLEINVDYLAAIALDVRGDTRVALRQTHDPSAQVEQTVDQAARLVADVVERALVRGASLLAGVGVAAPGLVDVASGVVRVAPNLGWRDVPLRDLLLRRLDPHPWDAVAIPHARASRPLQLLVDNEANLATLAEYATSDTADRDLVYVTGGVGVGGGIVVNGHVVRGHAGFAGEVGHLPVDPAGERCGCGRRGCWETTCGLEALLRLAADPDDIVRDHDRDLDERLDLLLDRARSGDTRTLQAFDRVGRALGHGASMLVNLVNPRVLVLGGYFARLGEFLLPLVEDELASRVVAPDLGGCRVTLSRLGLAAAATGAAYAALQPVLDDPTVVPIVRASPVPEKETQ